MKRLGLFLSFSLIMLVVLLAGMSETAVSSAGWSQRGVITDTLPAEIYSGRPPQSGILRYDNLAIFGPHICTDYGDPFSATIDPDGAFHRQNWRDDPTDRTYHYQIEIPADYGDDVVRVELFDPDSKNQPNNNGGSYTDTVAHTNIAIQNGMPPVETRSCNSTQKNTCLINTGEQNLGLDVDLVNLLWFARIDENRGNGSISNTGNGACGDGGGYNEAFNTITLYELYYLRENTGGQIVEVPLAHYYGQSGDMVVSRSGFDRDLTYSSYDHDTDMRWTTPGGQLSYDQPVTVPAGCGSPNGGDYDPVTCPGGSPAGPGSGFEINILDDLAGIITDENGNMKLFLEVTSMSGASENGYDVWAGPNNYVAFLASDVNARNVTVINNPQVHDSEGVETAAIGDKLTNSNINFRRDISLSYIGPEYAGQSVYISLFDSDAGTQPPIHFFFDTIAQSDFQLTFSTGNPDPDGETGRCQIGTCNNQFVDPAYRIDIPTLSEACTDPNDPAQVMVCTPFYGGRLMASYDGGINDTYLWHIRLPEPPPSNPTVGCQAFPITIEQGVQTVTQAEYETVLYDQFTYPTGFNRPDYSQFTQQPPGGTTSPLTADIEGQVFVLDFATFSPQSFDFLQWNEFITSASSGNTLANSLYYPGNSFDYSNHNDFPLTPPPDWPHTYRGFAEVGDPTDKTMHLGDRIAKDTISGGFGGINVTTTLNDHIDNGRTLRLPLWDHSSGNSSGSQYQASGFGLFRILGYSSNNWILLELVGLDQSCGQPSTAVTQATLDGPEFGLIDTAYPFTATVQNVTAAQPVTYTWQTTGQSPITQTNGLTDTAVFSWPTPGQKTITMTAENELGPPVVVTHTIQVSLVQVSGDTNCDTSRDVIDALYIMGYEVGTRTAAFECPLAPDTLFLPACDVNGDTACNVIDALFIMQCEVGIPNSLCPPPEPGKTQSDGLAGKPVGETAVSESAIRPNQVSTIQIDPASIAVGQTKALPVWVNVPVSGRLTAVTLDITFDPDLVSFVNCQTNDSDFNLSLCALQEGDGQTPDTISITALAVNGLNGRTLLTEIEFYGLASGISDLILTVRAFEDGSGQAPQLRGGKLTVGRNR